MAGDDENDPSISSTTDHGGGNSASTSYQNNFMSFLQQSPAVYEEYKVEPEEYKLEPLLNVPSSYSAPEQGYQQHGQYQVQQEVKSEVHHGYNNDDYTARLGYVVALLVVTKHLFNSFCHTLSS